MLASMWGKLQEALVGELAERVRLLENSTRCLVDFEHLRSGLHRALVQLDGLERAGKSRWQLQQVIARASGVFEQANQAAGVHRQVAKLQHEVDELRNRIEQERVLGNEERKRLRGWVLDVAEKVSKDAGLASSVRDREVL